jgi:hypothetical protein
MVPALVAFRVIDEPIRLAPTAMLPPPLACRVKRPLAVIGALTVTVPVSMMWNVEPVDAAEIVTGILSVTATAPVVLAIRLGELSAVSVIAPEPDESWAVPAVTVTVPPV